MIRVLVSTCDDFERHEYDVIVTWCHQWRHQL